MRSELSKAVRAGFRKRMAEELPQFGEVTDSPSRLRFGWPIAGDLTFFVTLVIHDRKDWFSLEVSWVRADRWKFVLIGADPDAEPGPGKDGVSFRVCRLWDRSAADYWWELAPRLSFISKSNGAFRERLLRLDDAAEGLTKAGAAGLERPSIADALSKVNEAVDDSIDRLRKYALPYFRQVAGRKGYTI